MRFIRTIITNLIHYLNTRFCKILFKERYFCIYKLQIQNI